MRRKNPKKYPSKVIRKTNFEVFVNDKKIRKIKTDNTSESKVRTIVTKVEITASESPIQK